MKKTLITTGTTIIMLTSQQLPDAFAETVKPLALRKIIQDLGQHMQSITDGISREDWEWIGITSARIADHPTPPFGEKLRILSFVGSDVSKFKSYDGKTHDAAILLGEAATQKDAQAVIQAFSNLQHSCMECHQTFRKRFLEKFYGIKINLDSEPSKINDF